MDSTTFAKSNIKEVENLKIYMNKMLGKGSYGSVY